MKKNKEKESHKHHEHNHIHDHAYENIKIAFLLNLLFAVIEIIGSLLTNSISILSDAIHDFGDSISIGLAYLFEKKSKKNPDNVYSFGYLRYSLLGALITSFILLFGSIFVVWSAIPRLFNPIEVNHDAMIIFAIFGVIINGYAAYRTSKGVKVNEKAINLHMLEDVFGWIIILIGSICIKIFGLNIIDSVLSILVALYILFHVYRNFKEIFDVFMEKVPKNINIEKIKIDIEKEFDSVKELHHIHIWTLDSINNCMTAHVLLNKDLKNKEVIELKKSIKNKLNDNNINHVTLEIEYLNEKCDDSKCN